MLLNIYTFSMTVFMLQCQSSFHKKHMAPKTYNFYYPVLYKKSLPTFALDDYCQKRANYVKIFNVNIIFSEINTKTQFYGICI